MKTVFEMTADELAAFHAASDAEDAANAAEVARLRVLGWQATYETQKTFDDWDGWQGTYTLTSPSGYVWRFSVEPSHNGVETELAAVAAELGCSALVALRLAEDE